MEKIIMLVWLLLGLVLWIKMISDEKRVFGESFGGRQLSLLPLCLLFWPLTYGLHCGNMEFKIWADKINSDDEFYKKERARLLADFSK